MRRNISNISNSTTNSSKKSGIVNKDGAGNNRHLPSETMYDVDSGLNSGFVRSSEIQTSQMMGQTGQSGQSNKRRKSFVGTISFMAPEILTKFINEKDTFHGYSYAVDLWSLGCTLYLLLTGKDPYKPMSVAQIQYGIPLLVTSTLYQEAHKELFGVPDLSILPHPEITLPLVSKLLTFDPAERVSISPSRYKNSCERIMKQTSGSGSKSGSNSGGGSGSSDGSGGGSGSSDVGAGLLPGFASASASGSASGSDSCYNYRLEDINMYHQHVKNDLFFKNVDWAKIEAQEMIPPKLPDIVNATVTTDDIPTGCSLHDILHYCNKDKWLALNQPLDSFADAQAQANINIINNNNASSPKSSNNRIRSSREKKSAYSVPNELQRFFKDWEYVSPEVVNVEKRSSFNLANQNSFSQSITWGSRSTNSRLKKKSNKIISITSNIQ